MRIALAQWSRALGTEGRLRIQSQLLCCGYYSPFVEASVSQLCYARSPLQGCKRAYLSFQRTTLERWYTASFVLVPIHLCCILSGLLCSNYVTYRFGKGMVPRAYRLNTQSMTAIMDNYASQLAEQYGVGAVSDILKQGPKSEVVSPEMKHEYSRFGPGDDLAVPTLAVDGHPKTT